MSLFRRLFGCKRFCIIRTYRGFGAQRIACTHCGRHYIIHDATRTLLPWDAELADAYEDWT
jgi:hypothetical protein